MKALRIGTDRKHELELRQPIEQGWMPELGALGSRRKVSAMRVLPRKAEAHGDDGDAGFVVELLRAHPHPVAQAVAGGVGEGNA